MLFQSISLVIMLFLSCYQNNDLPNGFWREGTNHYKHLVTLFVAKVFNMPQKNIQRLTFSSMCSYILLSVLSSREGKQRPSPMYPRLDLIKDLIAQKNHTECIRHLQDAYVARSPPTTPVQERKSSRFLMIMLLLL